MGHICYLKENKTTILGFKNSHSTGEVENVRQCANLFESESSEDHGNSPRQRFRIEGGEL